jgi:disease resistance protein RPM1
MVFNTKDGIILSSSINEIEHLEILNIESRIHHSNDVIDLDLISLPKLRRLTLMGTPIQKAPECIPKLQSLVELNIVVNKFTEDPMQSLKSLPNLLSLYLHVFNYEGCFHFEDGCFQKLKELSLSCFIKLREVVINKGTLPSLKKLEFSDLSGLKNIPIGIQHLDELIELCMVNMSNEFVQNISTEDWNLMQLVPLVHITDIYDDTIPIPWS